MFPAFFHRLARATMFSVAASFLAASARAQTGSAPFIMGQPSGRTVGPGGSATLSVTVQGSTPLSYQWYLNQSAIPGATGSSYTISPATPASAGTYQVTITNPAGTVTSDPATVSYVTSSLGPIITTQPAGQTVAYGAGMSFYVSASSPNGGSLLYQWSKDGTPIPGATSFSYGSNAVTSASAGSYTVAVTSLGTTVVSNPATLTVGPPLAPSFVSGPASQSVPYGGTLNFNCRATGSAPISYQWAKDGIAITGATNSYFNATNVTSANAGSYTVTATNAQGSATSPAAVVAVGPNTAPVIMAPPATQAVSAGAYLNLSVTATGSAPLSYQWFLNGVALPGSTANALNIFQFSAANAGSYTVTVSNSAGTVTSPAAVLSLSQAPTASPTLTLQPGSRIVTFGSSFEVEAGATASSSGGLTYQWYKDGSPLSTGYNSYYGVGSAAASDAGSYTCVISNASGSVTTAAATITVLPPVAPAITLQPVSDTANSGDSITLSVGTSGAPVPTLQWYKDGVAIPNATSPNFYISAANASSAGSYTVVASSSAGSATSSPAVVTVAAAGLPVITSQPDGQTVLPGASQAYFSVTATGGGPLSYQWYKDGTPITGQTSSSLTLPSPALSAAGTYTVAVTNSAGSVTSAAAPLTVLAPAVPIILNQPASIVGTATGSASFSVVATGVGTSLSYQWYLDGTALPNATSSYYSVPLPTSANLGTYTVTVSDSAGSVTSVPATLTLLSPPSITSQPQSVTAYAGASASFTIGATSSGLTTYQWYRNGAILSDGGGISGSNTPTLTLANVGASAGTQNYTVSISNSAGQVMSAPAALTVSLAGAPQLTSTPANQTVALGSSVTLTAAASGTPAPTFQWYFGNTPIAGATSATYTIPSVQPANAGSYTVVASNGGGSAAYTMTLAIEATPPALTQQPSGGSVSAGSSFTFTAAATGDPAPTYQWYFDGQAIAGANGPSYSIAAATSANSGSYFVTVANGSGSLSSQPAMLVVTAVSGGPILTLQPSNQTIAAGDTVVFRVSPNGTVAANAAAPGPQPNAAAPLAYQWFLNGVPIAGATDATLVLKAGSATAGNYTCLVSSSSGSVLSNAATLAVTTTTNPGRLINLSVLTLDGPGNQLLTVGFTSGGGTSNAPPESLLLRVTGPALQAFEVSHTLADPTLALFDSQTHEIDFNAGWGASTLNRLTVQTMDAQLGAFPLADPSSADSALVTTVPAGSYSIQAGSVSGGTGMALAEIYDATGDSYVPGQSPRLINLSSLQQVPAGGMLTAGFTVGGTTSKTVLVRVTGPALQAFNVASPMPDPTLTVFSGSTPIASNAGWGGAADIASADSAVGAFPLTDPNSADSALLVSLPPGLYSVQARSASNTAGAALIEVYEVP